MMRISDLSSPPGTHPSSSLISKLASLKNSAAIGTSSMSHEGASAATHARPTASGRGGGARLIDLEPETGVVIHPIDTIKVVSGKLEESIGFWHMNMPPHIFRVRDQGNEHICGLVTTQTLLYADLHINGYNPLVCDISRRVRTEICRMFPANKGQKELCLLDTLEYARRDGLPVAGKRGRVFLDDYVVFEPTKRSHYKEINRLLSKNPLGAVIRITKSFRKWKGTRMYLGSAADLFRDEQKMYKEKRKEEKREEKKKKKKKEDKREEEKKKKKREKREEEKRKKEEEVSTHAVTIVGRGIDETGEQYYYIQNSYGTGWGVGGYGIIKSNRIIQVFYPVDAYFSTRKRPARRAIRDENEIFPKFWSRDIYEDYEDEE